MCAGFSCQFWGAPCLCLAAAFLALVRELLCWNLVVLLSCFFVFVPLLLFSRKKHAFTNRRRTKRHEGQSWKKLFNFT